MADVERRATMGARAAGCVIAFGVSLSLLAACGDGAAGGAGGGDAQPGAIPGGGGCAIDAETHTGEGTYYNADGSGNCSFPATPDDLMVAAMNDADYQASAACGACIQLSGPSGEVTVRIVDRCPECPRGNVDMSPQAFQKIAALEAGRVPIRWRYVACDVSGPVIYHFKDGSSEYWTAVQVRNHRYPIARFEFRGADGAFHAVARESYNYFVAANGMGKGPYAFRVTDAVGHVIEDSGIPLKENGDSPGAAQLPACPSR